MRQIHAPLAAPLAALTLTALMLPGCIARTVADVATAPVRVAGKVVDLATTSQSEADEKRGRDMRRQEEHLGKLERDRARNRRDCEDGDWRACERADARGREIEDLRWD